MFLGLACQSAAPVTAATYNGVYVFGDSLVDNGNFYRQSQSYNFGNDLPPFPGSPETGYPGPPYYQGRFSNGPVFVEDLTSELGLPASALHDYAIGGSLSGYGHSDPNLPPAVFPGELTQVANYTSQPADPNGLYILATGSNDFDSISPTDPASIAAQVKQTVNNIDQAVTELAQDGAHNFLVVSVPDFGKLPQAAQLANGSPEVITFQTNLAETITSSLLSSLPGLSNSLNVNITPLDLFTLTDKAVADPAQFGVTGVTNVTDACYNSVTQNVCSNPNSYLFWDGVHPTAVGHQAIANAALAQLNQAQSVPEPVNIGGILTVTCLGAGYLLKRKIRLKTMLP